MTDTSAALAAFEVWANAHPGKWDTGRMVINGEFHHFMDPETDSAWMGFLGAWQQFNDAIPLLAPRGTRFTIEHDGFAGGLIGGYKRFDGKRGAVLQQDSTLVVHVYGEKWLKL